MPQEALVSALAVHHLAISSRHRVNSLANWVQAKTGTSGRLDVPPFLGYNAELGPSTSEAWAKMIENRGDRVAAVRKVAEAAGGKLESFFWSMGEDDYLAIVDAPHDISIGAVAVAVGSSRQCMPHPAPGKPPESAKHRFDEGGRPRLAAYRRAIGGSALPVIVRPRRIRRGGHTILSRMRLESGRRERQSLGVPKLPGFFRLRRSKQIIPGLRMNLSKSGISLSAGVRGAHYTVGPRGRRTTIGLPGSGVSYTTYSSQHARHAMERHSNPSKPQPAGTSAGSGASSKVPMLPSVKLAWGIVIIVVGLVLLVPFWPLGLLLLGGGVWLSVVGFNQRKQPKWQVRGLLRKASQNPGMRDALLGQALALDPENPEALAAAAENSYHKEDWVAADQLFERYLTKAPDDLQAQLHLGFSYMNAGETDQALKRLEPIRATYAAGEGPTPLINAVAIGFLKKGDAAQALEILKTLPLRKQTLDDALQQGLLLRSLAHWELHQKSGAISDVDRLYAINPEHAGLDKVREPMKAGTFDLGSVEFTISVN